jgi:hypothetical protein
MSAVVRLNDGEPRKVEVRIPSSMASVAKTSDDLTAILDQAAEAVGGSCERTGPTTEVGVVTASLEPIGRDQPALERTLETLADTIRRSLADRGYEVG